jgi:hypothetical protein
VIKQADKGNAVVLLDREYYRNKILDMLKDGMYYEETDKKADQKTYKMITKLLHEYEGELHKEEIGYITNFTFTESLFRLFSNQNVIAEIPKSCGIFV